MFMQKIKGIDKKITNIIEIFCLIGIFFSGLVPLHNACSYGHYEVTELLVKHGASVNVADLWKFTPLHEAAAKGKYEIVKLLLRVRIILFISVAIAIACKAIAYTIN